LVQFWFSSGLTSDALSGDQDIEHAQAAVDGGMTQV